jgi:hypothetical protein
LLGSLYINERSCRKCRRAEEVDEDLERQKMVGRSEEEREMFQAAKAQKALEKRE